MPAEAPDGVRRGSGTPAGRPASVTTSVTTSAQADPGPSGGDRALRRQHPGRIAVSVGDGSGGGASGSSGPAAEPRRRRIRYGRIVIAAVVALAGVKVVTSGVGAISGPPGPSGSALFGSWSGPAAAPLAASVPLRVRVPSLHINAPLIRLGVDSTGAVAVPPMTAPEEAGWYTGNPTPGERGAAVIVGHVDTSYGRAVFYPLGGIQPGADILVDRSDHKAARFRVTSVEVVDKNRFPAERVYGTGRERDPDSTPELRLITCGGAFDGQHYADNLVVYAQLVGSGPAGK